MKIHFGYQDTRTNNEDFAITPYLFLVSINQDFKMIGIGICWGWFSFHSTLGFNTKDFPRLIIYTRKRTILK